MALRGSRGPPAPSPNPAPHSRCVKDGSDVIIPGEGPEQLHHGCQVLLATAGRQQGGHRGCPHPWRTPSLRGPPSLQGSPQGIQLCSHIPVVGGTRTPSSRETQHSPPLHGGALFPLAPGILEQAHQDSGRAASASRKSGMGARITPRNNPHPKKGLCGAGKAQLGPGWGDKDVTPTR